MNYIIGKLLAWGWGKSAATTALRHGLSVLGGVLVAMLTEAGVDPVSLAGLVPWLMGLAPILVSVVWSLLAHRYGEQVATAALAADPTVVKAVADVRAAIAAGKPA